MESFPRGCVQCLPGVGIGLTGWHSWFPSRACHGAEEVAPFSSAKMVVQGSETQCWALHPQVAVAKMAAVVQGSEIPR